ncbi:MULTISPECIES: ImmA/IrrE family metallo-endopeptidase [unclassified Endozoicomonas]|uniref:ImmA/IrrE family metallo-endopeptidase n=1 Tax=unclassified Endozoicomonas TaxID=2644528 RepID=UPI003BB73628
MKIQRKKGRMVPPLSAKKIEKTASGIRSGLADPKERLNVVRFIELLLVPIMGLEFEVVENHELGGDAAHTYPDKNLMRCTQKVYDGACAENPRDIFTLAHEVGHFFLHKGTASFARSNEGREHQIYEDSEWQADEFASAFLMPLEVALECNSEDELCEMYGVSRSAAEARLRNINKRYKKK